VTQIVVASTGQDTARWPSEAFPAEEQRPGRHEQVADDSRKC
jgi:hypothetical protein